MEIPDEDLPKFRFQSKEEQDASIEDANAVGEEQARSQQQIRESMVTAPQHVLDAAARTGLRGSGYKRDRAEDVTEGWERARQIDSDAQLARTEQAKEDDRWKWGSQQGSWWSNQGSQWNRSRYQDRGGSSSSGYPHDPNPAVQQGRGDTLEQAQVQAAMRASATEAKASSPATSAGAGASSGSATAQPGSGGFPAPQIPDRVKHLPKMNK